LVWSLKKSKSGIRRFELRPKGASFFVRVECSRVAIAPTLRGGLFGIGHLRQFAPDEIKEFRGEEQMSSGSNIWKNLVVVPRKSKCRTPAKGIASKLALEAAIDELSAALGDAS
jgi:hypothetical protein